MQSQIKINKQLPYQKFNAHISMFAYQTAIIATIIITALLIIKYN